MLGEAMRVSEWSGVMSLLVKEWLCVHGMHLPIVTASAQNMPTYALKQGECEQHAKVCQ